MSQIYNNGLFLIEQNPTYPYVPGFFIIKEQYKTWDYNIEHIKQFCYIQKKIRTFLLKNNYTLVMSYIEHSEMNEMTLFIIPYNLKILNKMNINPEEPQSRMFDYLNYFTKKTHYIQAKKLANALKIFLNKEVIG